MALFIATANLARADFVLFHDKFEGTNLNQWIGKVGEPHHGVLVADPHNPANQVLSFSGVNFAGDLFNAIPLNVSRSRQYVLSFDFLGLPEASNPGLETGGFLGIANAADPLIQQTWVCGTYAPAVTAPVPIATTLVANGQWHHYEIDITALIDANDLSAIVLMLEDWGGLGSVPGDVFFDNISVVGLYDIMPILAQVPCEGPAPGKKWKNHGAYVSAVSKVVQTYLVANIIAPEEADQIMSLAGSSDCGKTK
ncbi:MAG: hypothetical protein QM813_04255 [Verrucomicrobiota bacterium]